MTRNDMISTLVARLNELGWTAVEVEDTDSEVTMIVGAEGATPQMATASLSALAGMLNDLGSPDQYPATEEYDLAPEVDSPVVAPIEDISEGHGVLDPVGEVCSANDHEPVAVDLPSPKEAYQGGLINDLDRGGMPYPAQVLAEGGNVIFRVRWAYSAKCALRRDFTDVEEAKTFARSVQAAGVGRYRFAVSLSRCRLSL